MKKIIEREYIECGLPEVWIQCRRVIDDAGEETYIMRAINQLHKLIANEIVNSEGALTGPEIKFLRSEIGWSQAQLGERIHRTKLTISRWEKGESVVDGAVDSLIRIISMDELKLKRIDLEKISSKYKASVNKKYPLRIHLTGAGQYRRAA